MTLMGNTVSNTPLPDISTGRVVFVDHAADPGGGQLGLLRFLRNTRIENVKVIFLTGGSLLGQFEATGHEIVVLSKKPFTLKRSVWLAARLRDEIGHDAAVVVANSLYSAVPLALRRPRARRLLYYSRVSMDSLRGYKRLLGMGALFPRFDGFIANSRWTASCIPRWLTRRRTVDLAYPVSGVRDRPERYRRFEAGQDKAFRFASLSRPDRWKGTDLLIQAVSAIKPELVDSVSLHIYGGTFYSDPNFLTEIKELALRSPIPIHFEGHVDDVDQILDSVDAVILSTRQPEPFGQVVVQSMAHGAVTIVPDQGGPMEMIRDRENGRVFRAGDTQSLRDVLESVISDRADLATLVERARLDATAFSDTRTTEMLESAILPDGLTQPRFSAE